MFWDKISPLYDLFENIYNHKVYAGTGRKVAEYIDPSDTVLECACGTGAISVFIAPICKKMIATDFSTGMLRKAAKKLKKYDNVGIKKADITALKCKDGRFDKVVAGNVIHLLPEPEKALCELLRVTKPGGMVIIPTYINKTKKSSSLAVKAISFLGADFKQQFDLDSYKQFFEDMREKNSENAESIGDIKDIKFTVVDGRMPCAVAVIRK